MSIEISLFLCENHLLVDLKKPYPEYCFSCFQTLEERNCRVEFCPNPAVMKMIGYIVPSYCEDASRFQYHNKTAEEILIETTNYLLLPGTALERLTLFLFYKIRVAPLGADWHAMQLCKLLATYILKDLNIDPNKALIKPLIHGIVRKLQLYPVDYED